jgi:hypothetical protein
MRILRAWLVVVLVMTMFAACGGSENEEAAGGGTERNGLAETTVRESPAETVGESPPAEQESEMDYWDGPGFGDRLVYQSGAGPHVSLALHEALAACDFSDEDADYVVDTFETTGANFLISSGHGGSSLEVVDLGGGVFELKVECGSE